MWYRRQQSLDLESHYYTCRARESGAMDPQLKLALDAQTKSFTPELHKTFAVQDAKWETCISGL